MMAPGSLRVVLLGSGGGPIPVSGVAGPGALVEANSERFLFDCGRCVVPRMTQIGLMPSAVTCVFLTHLHSDHVTDIPDLWLSGFFCGRETPLEIRGPAGTRSMVKNLRAAFSVDVETRIGLPKSLPPSSAAVTGVDVEEGVVYEKGGLTVSAVTAEHGSAGASLAYRVDFDGHSVVFSGDDKHSEDLIRASVGVDVLFHAMYGWTAEELGEDSEMGARRRIWSSLMATPEEVADTFLRSQCRVAALIHSSSDLLSISRIRKTFHGRLEVPGDLTEFVIGDQIIVRPIS